MAELKTRPGADGHADPSMSDFENRRTIRILIVLALVRLAVHVATNGNYGFHRDELVVVDDARYLAWGYVAYPPFTPFVARVAFELFGASVTGLRFFSALAQSIAMVLAGLIAREMGGGRNAQVLAALATAIAPMSLVMGSMFQYIAFDYLWWVTIAWLMVRMIRTDDARLWLPIGGFIGLGMLTKYTMAFFAVSVAIAVFLTPLRKSLKSVWLWAGVALSLLIFAPNLIWQVQHEFVSFRFLDSIHARDVEIGRTDGYLSMQLFVSANPFTLPLWIAGLFHLFASKRGRHYRTIGWLYVIPLLLFLFVKGRFYYLAPAYPMLLAAGALRVELWIESLAPTRAAASRAAVWAALVAGALFGGLLMLPVAPINSPLWNFTAGVHDNFVEQVGWPELAETVSSIHRGLPPGQKEGTVILTGNYGEAGAINLYGPPLGLPGAISGINSYWYRGWGGAEPERVILLGFSREKAETFFQGCRLARTVTNRHGVENEETRFHREIFLCKRAREPWKELWPKLQSFG